MSTGTAVTATGGMTATAFIFYDGGNNKGNHNYEYERDNDCSHVMPPCMSLSGLTRQSILPMS